LHRESRRVRIDGYEECWTLAWAAPPASVCPAGNGDSYCELFPEGQEGDLDVIRSRAGARAQRVRLRCALPGRDTVRMLRVFGHQGNDAPQMRLLNFRDFDRDGRDAEIKLVLRPGDGVLDEAGQLQPVADVDPERFYRSVIIGVGPGSRRLSAIGDARTPQTPLIFPGENGWNLILEASSDELHTGREITLVSCAGPTFARTVRVHAGPSGVLVDQVKRSCACGAEGCTWQNQPVLGTAPWPGPGP
jgi:hypothetical protein